MNSKRIPSVKAYHQSGTMIPSTLWSPTYCVNKASKRSTRHSSTARILLAELGAEGSRLFTGVAISTSMIDSVPETLLLPPGLVKRVVPPRLPGLEKGIGLAEPAPRWIKERRSSKKGYSGNQRHINEHLSNWGGFFFFLLSTCMEWGIFVQNCLFRSKIV